MIITISTVASIVQNCALMNQMHVYVLYVALVSVTAVKHI